jgi:hypothetical protein
VLFLASNAALRVSNKCVLRRFLKQFVAVVVGSLLYFFVLMPHLPLAGRHQPFRIDLGLVVNLWVCLVLQVSSSGSIESGGAKAQRERAARGSVFHYCLTSEQAAEKASKHVQTLCHAERARQ